jgi:hypothetical protein
MKRGDGYVWWIVKDISFKVCPGICLEGLKEHKKNPSHTLQPKFGYLLNNTEPTHSLQKSRHVEWELLWLQAWKFKTVNN